MRHETKAGPDENVLESTDSRKKALRRWKIVIAIGVVGLAICVIALYQIAK